MTSNTRSNQSTQVGVMLPNWIGDVVMATPALRAIRRKFGGGATYVGVMKPYVADVLSGLQWFDEIVFFDARSPDRTQRARDVTRQLRARQLDWMFLLPNSLRAGLMARLARARRRVGYDRYGRSMLLTDKLTPPRHGQQLEPVSAVDYFLELAYTTGCPTERPQLELATLPDDERHADMIWERFQLDRANGVVIFNTGGAYGSAKSWPAEYFATLGQHISDLADRSVLIICGPSERGQADEIEWRANRPNVHSLAKDDVTVGLTKACIRRSELLVTTDSGPRHFAAAFSVPSIAIFGPTDTRWSKNYHAGEIQLRQDIGCSPCGQRECPELHHHCMRQLTVDRVFAAVRKILDQPAHRKAA